MHGFNVELCIAVSPRFGYCFRSEFSGSPASFQVLDLILGSLTLRLMRRVASLYYLHPQVRLGVFFFGPLPDLSCVAGQARDRAMGHRKRP
jgi:hypothetical protein